MLAPPPLPKRSSRWLQALKVLSIASGITVAALASGLLLLMWSCTPPSIETLQRRFPQERHDLEIILAMSNEGKHLLRIDPNWLMTDKPAQYMEYDPAVGMSLDRWNQYRKLFSRNNITQGIQREPDSDDAFIMVKSEGLLNRGISNGYLYCGVRPVHRYAPCTDSRPRGNHPFEAEGVRDEGYSFIRLDGGWYAVSFGPS